jgi:hypothetical protein
MGFHDAQSTSAAVLHRLLEAQARVEAFSDAYGLIALLFVAMVPLAISLARHAPGRFAPVE